MNKTYSQIIDEMKAAYYDEYGFNVKTDSELDKIFAAVASEIYSVSCYNDYVFKQSFVQSATGKELDKHATLRGLRRKQSSKAYGNLRFYIDEPYETEIKIPTGTICSIKQKPYLQYETIENAVIPAGELFAVCSANALEEGEMYNCDIGDIDTLVDAPIGITGVINETPFIGGMDYESDSSLRGRIINAYNVPQNGLNSRSIENSILNLDFIVDCYVAPIAETAGKINIYVSTTDNILTDEQKQSIKNSVSLCELVGADCIINLAVQKDISITVQVYVRSGFDFDSVNNKVEDTVREYCSVRKIGSPIIMSEMLKKLLVIDGIGSVGIYSDDAAGDIITCPMQNYLHLNELAVKCFEE